MTEDVTPKIIADVNKEFSKNLANDKKAETLSRKLATGKAGYKDAYSYAESIGSARAKAFKQISSATLPDGKMYYNIASRLMTDALTSDGNMIAEYASGVQKICNDKAKISLKALKAEVDPDRIDGFVQRLASEEVFDDVAWILQEPVKTFARSVVDDTIKKNADFQNKVGIMAVVIRRAAAKCCDWCADLEGEYNPPYYSDLFQRHDNCRCTLDYEGRRLTTYYKNGRDTHTFRDQGEQEKIDTRKEISEKRATAKPDKSVLEYRKSLSDKMPITKSRG